MPAHPPEHPTLANHVSPDTPDAPASEVHRWDSPEDYPAWDHYFLIRWSLAFVVVLGFGVITLLGL